MRAERERLRAGRAPHPSERDQLRARLRPCPCRRDERGPAAARERTPRSHRKRDSGSNHTVHPTMHPFVAAELPEFVLDRALRTSLLPLVPRPTWRSNAQPPTQENCSVPNMA